MTEWQPIETAPKDGTVLLLVRRRLKEGEFALADPEVVIGTYTSVWVPENKEWVALNPCDLGGQRSATVSALTIAGDRGELINQIGPTHWMPLPEPPK